MCIVMPVRNHDDGLFLLRCVKGMKVGEEGGGGGGLSDLTWGMGSVVKFNA